MRKPFVARLDVSRHVTVIIFPRVGRYVVGYENNLQADSWDILLLVIWVRVYKEGWATIRHRLHQRWHR